MCINKLFVIISVLYCLSKVVVSVDKESDKEDVTKAVESNLPKIVPVDNSLLSTITKSFRYKSITSNDIGISFYGFSDLYLKASSYNGQFLIGTPKHSLIGYLISADYGSSFQLVRTVSDYFAVNSDASKLYNGASNSNQLQLATPPTDIYADPYGDIIGIATDTTGRNIVVISDWAAESSLWVSASSDYGKSFTVIEGIPYSEPPTVVLKALGSTFVYVINNVIRKTKHADLLTNFKYWSKAYVGFKGQHDTVSDIAFSGTTSKFYAITVSSQGIVFPQGILRSSDGGNTWSQYFDLISDYRSISSDYSGKYVYASSVTTIAYSANFGATFTTLFQVTNFQYGTNFIRNVLVDYNGDRAYWYSGNLFYTYAV